MWMLEVAVLGSAWALPGAFKILHGSSMQWLNQSIYHVLLLPALLLAMVLAWLARPAAAEKFPPGFRKHLCKYLIVWASCVAADWLQGPYIYALYAAYGHSDYDIAVLFVAGYGASGVCSCGVGSIADRFGRKKCCLAYCVLHTCAALSTHWNLYWVLLLGRVLAGAGTSILFSCFECWMVSEHTAKHRFSANLLAYMFGLKFCTMYLVAVLAGLTAQVVVDSSKMRVVEGRPDVHLGGYTAPYDLSAALLCVGFCLICTLWSENYGETSPTGSKLLMWDAVKTLIQDVDCLRLCLLVAIFEGSMYVFVSNWTPALQSEETSPPHGLVFALFMLAATCGSSAATLGGRFIRPRRQLRFIMLLCVLAFALASRSACTAIGFCLAAFLTFEFCVGWYFPCIGIVKSEIVPDRIRGSMYNLFRVPLNVLVLVLLLADFGSDSKFAVCSFLLLLAMLATFGLGRKPTSLAEIREVSCHPAV
mmetsp:Transcript_8633/g.20513  ORF Transcript_8633/g.20513 Transcript_8633/m.20513 type:complete len:477 (+) Transcript_8633:59-1489(+)